MPRKTRRCQPAREIYCAITLTPASSVSRPAKASMPITPNPNRRTDRPAGPALSPEPPGGTPAHQHRTGTPDPRRDKGTAPPRCRPISPDKGARSEHSEDYVLHPRTPGHHRRKRYRTTDSNTVATTETRSIEISGM